MIALVWQFDVQAGRNDEFESFYGADGPWTSLSRRSRSYLGSSFMEDASDIRGPMPIGTGVEPGAHLLVRSMATVEDVEGHVDAPSAASAHRRDVEHAFGMPPQRHSR